MLRIIFWNVKRNDLNDLVCSMAQATHADVVVLNENQVPAEETLIALQEEVSPDFYHPLCTEKSEKRFQCFCKHRRLNLSEVHAGSRTSYRKLQLGSHTLLLALVHGKDPRNHDAAYRQSFTQSLATDIRLVKEQQNIHKLILLGDFNMNPYDRGMNLAAGLNAMMTKACVRRGYRTDDGERYDFYYNPMWSLFGDNTDGPAGTIYDTSNQGPYGWSMFDQVLVSHTVVDVFSDVQILTAAGSTSLMNRQGHPDKVNVSDHFPLLVTLDGETDE